jgi:hypothetical protein
VSNNIEKVIRKNIGEESLQKIQARLFEQYNISLDNCLWEYEKFDSVLREFFGEKAVDLEKKLFKSLHKFSV